MYFFFKFAIIILLLFLSSHTVAENSKKKNKKKSTDWDKLDIDKLEKNWESGDEAEELEMQFEHDRKISEKKSQQSGVKFDPNDPASVKNYMKEKKNGIASEGGGPTMMFIELTPKQLDGAPWTPTSRTYLSGKWSTLLKTGSVDAELYDIGDTSLLINVKKGWMVQDALKYILKQPETIKVTKDSRDIFLKDIVDENNDEEL